MSEQVGSTISPDVAGESTNAEMVTRAARDGIGVEETSERVGTLDVDAFLNEYDGPDVPDIITQPISTEDLDTIIAEQSKSEASAANEPTPSSKPSTANGKPASPTPPSTSGGKPVRKGPPKPGGTKPTADTNNEANTFGSGDNSEQGLVSGTEAEFDEFFYDAASAPNEAPADPLLDSGELDATINGQDPTNANSVGEDPFEPMFGDVEATVSGSDDEFIKELENALKGDSDGADADSEAATEPKPSTANGKPASPTPPSTSGGKPVRKGPPKPGGKKPTKDDSNKPAATSTSSTTQAATNIPAKKNDGDTSGSKPKSDTKANTAGEDKKNKNDSKNTKDTRNRRTKAKDATIGKAAKTVKTRRANARDNRRDRKRETGSNGTERPYRRGLGAVAQANTIPVSFINTQEAATMPRSSNESTTAEANLSTSVESNDDSGSNNTNSEPTTSNVANPTTTIESGNDGSDTRDPQEIKENYQEKLNNFAILELIAQGRTAIRIDKGSDRFMGEDREDFNQAKAEYQAALTEHNIMRLAELRADGASEEEISTASTMLAIMNEKEFAQAQLQAFATMRENKHNDVKDSGFIRKAYSSTEDYANQKWEKWSEQGIKGKVKKAGTFAVFGATGLVGGTVFGAGALGLATIGATSKVARATVGHKLETTANLQAKLTESLDKRSSAMENTVERKNLTKEDGESDEDFTRRQAQAIVDTITDETNRRVRENQKKFAKAYGSTLLLGSVASNFLPGKGISIPKLSMSNVPNVGGRVKGAGGWVKETFWDPEERGTGPKAEPRIPEPREPVISNAPGSAPDIFQNSGSSPEIAEALGQTEVDAETETTSTTVPEEPAETTTTTEATTTTSEPDASESSSSTGESPRQPVGDFDGYTEFAGTEGDGSTLTQSEIVSSINAELIGGMDVAPTNGFTHQFMALAEANGLKMSPTEAYDMYTVLRPELAQLDGVYEAANGEIRISKPETLNLPDELRVKIAQQVAARSTS